MPQLVLSRSEHGVTVKYADASVEGYPVVIAKRYSLTLLLFLWLLIYAIFKLYSTLATIGKFYFICVFINLLS